MKYSKKSKKCRKSKKYRKIQKGGYTCHNENVKCNILDKNYSYNKYRPSTYQEWALEIKKLIAYLIL